MRDWVGTWKLSTGDREELLRGLDAGMSARAVAVAMGISLPNVHYHRRRLLGPSPRGVGRYPRIPDAKRAAMVADLRAGVRNTDVARKYGVDPGFVSRLKAPAGLPVRPWNRRRA